ncbi:ABC transporter permease [Ketogulonicigenium vulgare]|uniref:ABC-type nitrate/sulfonate/bicarbonate transport system, permease component n=1 Tax=Ketogulonicigenium vulgare (strain WSH-001) TaxID=759362 RepID=F9YA62_KETVW|nr:ABC transporter permease subunit [Ketogulonicigenium vulgare]AEM41473.1 ABC-type nitrate/sulfonate/bicarbonate transport system, permease component [Ketogulonicigenium vulgare WSH-001]ALJ82374.1 nitrate ABC transporter permease [Ketogulonicigenium vulgare]ANW35133.1 nitrate ABC transporter permease [Ketogulonicigenium vulgare]AOZ55212.1 ABC-type nitrate/sulfonate/bicarbonate transport system, permease component [Ketogulonicigenium vulgare]
MTEIAPKIRTEAYAPTPVAPPRTPAQKFAATFLPPLIMGVLVVLLYWVVRESLPAHRQFLMPSASGMWDKALSQPAVWAELGSRSLTTLTIALTGLAFSIPIGMALGIIMFRFFVMERAVYPFLVALQSIPIMAIIPLIQSALGFGFMPKVLIVILFTFFAIPTTLLLGLKSLDQGVLNLFRLQGASWWTMLRKAGLPSSAPALFAGFRISTSMAVIAAVTSELFFMAGRGGLGQMLVNAKTDFKYEQMYAALIASATLSISIFVVFTLVGNRIFASWYETAERKS